MEPVFASSPSIDSTARYADIDLLHPIMRDPVRALMKALDARKRQTKTLCEFRVFETWRSPKRQRELLIKKQTKADEWQSWHQWGLAVDVVPFTPKGWSWDVLPDDWRWLRLEAMGVGLAVPISWDKAHVQHPVCDRLLAGLRYPA